MDAFRRGWLGLALFLSALVLMPVLVVQFQHDASRASEAADDLAAQQTTPASSQPAQTGMIMAPTSAPPGTLTRFEGVAEGTIIQGFQRITLSTTGQVGGIRYTLTGPGDYSYTLDAQTAPYLFNPHPGGWLTSDVDDGLYTLRAAATNPGIAPATIRFRIQNAAATPRHQPT
ncbi:hypothetical protein [Parafrankia sp. EUN1f]|uniref:hypothetical protein n=1 Tax=Parafrankia sp. EUN1f TaxID=102897 RepID=UPI0005675955|nr:hypothetical protein [Parafrankia sp. EUN1f]